RRPRLRARLRVTSASQARIDPAAAGGLRSAASQVSWATSCAVASSRTRLRASARTKSRWRSRASGWIGRDSAVTASFSSGRLARALLGRQALPRPLGPARVHLLDVEAPLCQLQSDLGGELSRRVPAIGDVLLALVETRRELLDRLERHRDRAGDVVLVVRGL